MNLANFHVKIALIIMYIIGLIVLAITLFILKKHNGHFFTKYSAGVMLVMLIMIYILNNLFHL